VAVSGLLPAKLSKVSTSGHINKTLDLKNEDESFSIKVKLDSIHRAYSKISLHSWLLGRKRIDYLCNLHFAICQKIVLLDILTHIDRFS
jgi:hypothetical protein